MVVEALTDNRKRTAPHVRAIFSKHGGALGAEGSVAWQFDHLDGDDVMSSVFIAAVDHEAPVTHHEAP